ncbi:MAG: porphobilinogen synthase [Acidobacteria bacterium]|nr:porphobilinogen synthase [Acidobacteriota bacterium]
MPYPLTRARRLRLSEGIRAMVRETHLTPDRLLYPMFVCPGEGVSVEISSMPGNYQRSIDKLVEEARSVRGLGIRGIILFGIPASKDEQATSAHDDRGIIQEAVRAIKREVKDLLVITDVCLCEYTSHGHCGLVRGSEIRNDATIDLLAKVALSHVRAGADIVAPSDMMDGRVAAVRNLLEKSGHHNIPIISYAVKYASAFFGPFREAAESAPAFGDRRTYQMDPANAREAIREAEQDIEEGADILMVAPAGPCLDIIRILRDRFPHPIAAFQASGEYAALVAASRLHWLDLQRVMIEALIGIRRAGADIVATYFAREAAQLLS